MSSASHTVYTPTSGPSWATWTRRPRSATGSPAMNTTIAGIAAARCTGCQRPTAAGASVSRCDRTVIEAPDAARRVAMSSSSSASSRAELRRSSASELLSGLCGESTCGSHFSHSHSSAASAAANAAMATCAGECRVATWSIRARARSAANMSRPAIPIAPASASRSTTGTSPIVRNSSTSALNRSHSSPPSSCRPGSWTLVRLSSVPVPNRKARNEACSGSLVHSKGVRDRAADTTSEVPGASTRRPANSDVLRVIRSERRESNPALKRSASSRRWRR